MTSLPILLNEHVTERVQISLTKLLSSARKYVMIFSQSNPISCILELVLYLTVGYIITARLIRRILKWQSVSPYARDFYAEVVLLGMSSTATFYLVWQELQPKPGVLRKNNTLYGIFILNRLFDEAIVHLVPSSRRVFTFVTAMLTHSAGVSWYNYGVNVQALKKAVFLVFYVTAYMLRLKYQGHAAAMLISGVEVLLQTTRLCCCIETKHCRMRVFTTLLFVVYQVTWWVVFLFVFPNFFLIPSLHVKMNVKKINPMMVLTGSLWTFYALEVMMMPLLRLLMLLVDPPARLVRYSRMERMLLPFPTHLLYELQELRKRKLETKAAQQGCAAIRGSSANCRAMYKNLRMIIAVKRRIRNRRLWKMRQEMNAECPENLFTESSSEYEFPSHAFPPENTSSGSSIGSSLSHTDTRSDNKLNVSSGDPPNDGEHTN